MKLRNKNKILKAYNYLDDMCIDELKDIYLGFMGKWEKYKVQNMDSALKAQYDGDKKIMTQIALRLDKLEKRG